MRPIAMATVADRFEFTPPPAPGIGPAMALAVLVHLVLLAALTWGVSWRRDANLVASAVELWATVPQESAPKKEAENINKTTEKPAKDLSTSAPAPPAPPDIVTEREKKRLADSKKAEDGKRREADAAKKLAAQRAAVEADRQKRLEQLTRLAGTASAADGKGPATHAGTAAQSAGPSASYAGRIVARVRPNIVFTEQISGNPVAEVEVRTAPDGSILSRRLLKSSGIRAWDDAVLKAIDKTEVLPRDVDGRVPSSLIIGFRPRDQS
ncbi:MAG: hypothetical protein RLZZ126_1612 [Pseudomonadota bacterium]|jgi:colicin import membrane protein